MLVSGIWYRWRRGDRAQWAGTRQAAGEVSAVGVGVRKEIRGAVRGRSNDERLDREEVESPKGSVL